MIYDYEEAALSVQEHNDFLGIRSEQFTQKEIEEDTKNWKSGFSVKWKYAGAKYDLCFIEDWQSTKENAIEKCKSYKKQGLKSSKVDVNKINLFVTTGNENKVIFEI